MVFEAFVALRYLRARRKQTFLSIISFLSMAGVGLGVCALIVVLSVMSGFETELKRKILGLNAHVTLFKAGDALERPQMVVDKALKDPQVTAASPFVYGQIMIVSDSAASGAIVRGIDLPKAIEAKELERTMIRGQLRNLSRSRADGLPGVVLGSALAQRLLAHVGSVVNLVNPLGEDTPVGRAPKSEPFRVVGLFESGMYQYDSALCYVSLSSAQDLMLLGKAVSGVEVLVKDIYQAGEVARRLGKVLGPLYFARDWMAVNHSLFSALKLEKFTMFVILILIVFGGGLRHR